jgi:hypothetical protein
MTRTDAEAAAKTHMIDLAEWQWWSVHSRVTTGTRIVPKMSSLPCYSTVDWVPVEWYRKSRADTQTSNRAGSGPSRTVGPLNSATSSAEKVGQVSHPQAIRRCGFAAGYTPSASARRRPMYSSSRTVISCI